MDLKNINIFETSLKLLIPMSLSFIINGRFSFALLGFSLLVLNLVRREKNIKTSYFFDLIGIIYVNATSGTALAGFLLFLIGNYRFLLKDIKYFLSKSLFGKIVKDKLGNTIFIFLTSSIVFFI